MGRKKKNFFDILITLALLFGLGQLFYSLIGSSFSKIPYDFGVYYYAARSILTGLNPYHSLLGGDAFQYAPNSLLVFAFTGFFEPETAFIVWTILSFLAVVLSVLLIIKTLKLNINYFTFCLLLILVIGAFPMRFNLSSGQPNNFLLLAFAASFWAYTTKRNLLAGFFLTLIGGIKIFPLFVGSYFLIKKQYKVIVSVLFSFLFLYFFTAGIFGSYLITIFPQLSYERFDLTAIFSNKIYYNQALTGFLARLYFPTNLSIALYLIFFIILIFFTIKTITRKTLEKGPTFLALEYSLFILLWLILGGFSWQHYFTVLIFPFLSVLSFIQRKPESKILFVPLFLSYFLVASNLRDGIFSQYFPAIILSHVFYGTMILYILVIRSLGESQKIKV
ncbi:MAG: glycosyltransferase family 87 protein [bacterium]|nr:glycosyltransferase family 87 protein [bacterium]